MRYTGLNRLIMEILVSHPLARIADIAEIIERKRGHRISSNTIRARIKKLGEQVNLPPEVRQILDDRREYIARRGWQRKEADPEAILESIRRLASSLGRTPTYSEYLKNRPGPPMGQVLRHFKAWSLAVEAAGLKPNRTGLRTQPLRDKAAKRARAVNALKEAGNILGYPPGANAYQSLRNQLRRSDWPSDDAIRLLFKSWSQALAEAGQQTLNARHGKTVYETLRRFAGRTVVAESELPKSPSKRAIARDVLARSGVKLVGRSSMREPVSSLLITAAKKKFPNVKGLERAREFTIRVAGGQAYQEIGDELGLTASRVCQLVNKYLTATAGIEKESIGHKTNGVCQRLLENSGTPCM